MTISIQAGRHARRHNAAATPVAAALAVASVCLLLLQRTIRNTEALLSSTIVRVMHVRHAQQVGAVVVFPLRGHYVGYELSIGCTVALLLMPFFLIGAGLMASGRVRLRQGLESLAAVTVILIVVNQLRFLMMASSMALWGFRAGYERSHVFLGTVLSTIGVVVGVIVFIFLVASERRPEVADDEL